MDLVADALADSHTQGVVVCGPAGVGKTRLAEECLAAARRGGRVVGRATASAAAATVPLGALVPLLPPRAGDRSDLVALFDWVAAAFRERAGDSPFVLLVDDLHLLDVTSAVLLGQMLDAGVVFLLGTVRDGEPLSADVARWWRSERMVRIDLGDLSADGVDGLLHLALGGPVTAAMVGQVWTASRGNPLFVRELVLGAQTAGNLVDESGVWRLTGPLHSTTRLADLVGSRMDAVGSNAWPALELLALAEPAGLSELEELVGAQALEVLERAGLIDVRADRRRQLVSMAHPLYGEVLRDRIPKLTRRRLLLAHVERIERQGARRREDLLRIATWRLDATGTADPKLLVVAARLARYGYDLAQAARLARAALTDLDTGPARIEAQLVLGEALAELGEFAEAEDVLAQAQSAAEDERQLVQLVAIRVRTLLWGLRQPDLALEVNRAVCTRVTGRDAREELIANEATLLMFSGYPVEALSVLATLDGAADLRTRVLRAIPEASALVATGRAETAAKVAERGFAEHVELGDQLAIAYPGTHLISQVYALQEAGRITEATELAMGGYEIASRDRSPIGRIWFAVNLGRCAMLAGRPQTGRRWLAEARALCREYGWHGPHRLALSALAIVTAWLGDTAGARDAVDEQDTLGTFGHLHTEQDLGRAWAVAAEGDLVAARNLARAAAARAAAAGHLSSEALLLHDLARFGDPADARDRLTDLAGRCEGVLIATYAEHARAAAVHDPQALSAVADRFEAMGADLMAAEAATEAGHAYLRHGNPRTAANLRARAATLAARCEGARTPALVTTAAVPLTRREREIALLARRGATSRQIADRLSLSVRTVDNHLQNVYTKLGITARDQLSAALPEPGGPAGEPPVRAPVQRRPPRPS
jgi:DNA-binding CsgD family transcriptional regulator